MQEAGKALAVAGERSIPDPAPLPRLFHLENRAGDLLSSTEYEYDEQSQLLPLLRDGDRVLHLGG